MDGILPVYKPAGMTSADVVSKLRYLLRMKKVGHSGTLDPSVDGVLPIALGAATKAVPALMNLGKTYTGSATLGLATETEDLDGAEVARQRLAEPFTDGAIDAALATLTGAITQIPPMYSAVKVNGRRLYDYARKGETVERPRRQATVYRFDRTAPSTFDAAAGTQTFSFEAQVSKGTYIRTLAVDVGGQLGVPAVMAQLTRIQSGGFTLADTLDLRPLTRETAPAVVAAHLQPIEFAYPHLPLTALDETQWQRVQDGRGLTLAQTAPQVGLTYQGILKAVYEQHENEYRPAVMFLANAGLSDILGD
ncbi:MAG: tRNA pseudouridine(55) synthase TruB [Lactobacillus sp.]|jgi:tRNA pseudouridine55 synthase|uniref:tRNA pseudouridine synthase B n=1 Tax=Lacticaseibacillus suilingensis TaxID=2799577 RepID=A0ABW4BHC2_9LACO|nr:tRNA pseudouridine(55) synthase TruB [Lacticaseibacillus suilingensis]MCI1894980.1 tRNA pseudouridine(55) synthase TruB [Lactobacillus sp.]MCI1917758.1 tRNA pseudouridine(55) synthase TruB [Lactobacillus sp.]MCI1940759.1 tRNA pseudouridine(55) synthase TruB [Lactobacillus sp.]MCI1971445.1 tRNA pseudouridine(55) synthase TruB [Lactobacillus sp.]MCI2017579.1 tRNA pseudouridine(55) synthase TruB [Lactobacillus sp.]